MTSATSAEAGPRNLLNGRSDPEKRIRLSRSPLNIGFLVNDLASDYQRRIFSGLDNEAQRLNVNVLCLAGGPIGVTGWGAHQARLYDCISSAHLDALVIVTGTLSGAVSPELLSEFVESFSPLPICSVGVQLANVPSVTVDNAAGEREAFKHLIERAGRRRIAFVRGPANNPEAEARYQVYKQLLSDYHLPFNPDLVTQGSFDAATGSRAVATLIDERHVAFDAIMAANDLMALGAMNALLERNVSVPEKVSIVGFDDIEAARFAAAPLTTVRQPLADLGRRALESVVSQLYDTESPRQVILHAELIHRNSTTQAPPHTTASQPSEAPAQVADASAFNRLFEQKRHDLCIRLNALLPSPGPLEGWPEELCTAFVSEISRRRGGLLQRISFLQQIERVLLATLEQEGDAGACQTIIDLMREVMVPLTRSSPALRDAAEDLWHEGRISCSSLAQRFQVQRRLQHDFWRHSVQELGAQLLRSQSWAELQRIASQQLPGIGVKGCFLCTFEANGQCKLRVALENCQPLDPTAFETFARDQMLPAALLHQAGRHSFLAHSLYDEANAIGYVIFELGPPEPETYSLLQEYFTGALRGILASPNTAAIS